MNRIHVRRPAGWSNIKNEHRRTALINPADQFVLVITRDGLDYPEALESQPDGSSAARARDVIMNHERRQGRDPYTINLVATDMIEWLPEVRIFT